MSERLDIYLDNRFRPQLAWFEKAAARAKQRHGFLSTAQLCATAAIPATNVLTQSTTASTVIAVLATIAAGLLALFGHREEWLRYRRTAAALESIKARFDVGLTPFDGDDGDAHFMEACEEVLGGELGQWETQVRARAVPHKAKAKLPKNDDED